MDGWMIRTETWTWNQCLLRLLSFLCSFRLVVLLFRMFNDQWSDLIVPTKNARLDQKGEILKIVRRGRDE